MYENTKIEDNNHVSLISKIGEWHNSSIRFNNIGFHQQSFSYLESKNYCTIYVQIYAYNTLTIYQAETIPRLIILKNYRQENALQKNPLRSTQANSGQWIVLIKYSIWLHRIKKNNEPENHRCPSFCIFVAISNKLCTILS